MGAIYSGSCSSVLLICGVTYMYLFLPAPINFKSRAPLYKAIFALR